LLLQQIFSARGGRRLAASPVSEVALSGTPLSCQMFVKEEVEKPIGSLIRNHYHLR